MSTPPSRRIFLLSIITGSVALTGLTLGQSFSPLRNISLLIPRKPFSGPQSLPVNTTAKAARVEEKATAAAYRLLLKGEKELSLSLEDIEKLPKYTARIPIACVEGWSSSAVWEGVRLQDLARLVHANPRAARVVSLQTGSRYAASDVDEAHLMDPLTLLAFSLNGEGLNLDHGFPLRLISPNRPGVMQTKWVSEVTFS